MKPPHFKIKSIQTRLMVYFLILVTIVISMVSVSIYFSQKSMLFDQAREKAFSLTRSLAFASLNAILADEYITLQFLIDSMSDSEDIISIRIIDTGGKVIAADNPALRGTVLDDPLTREASDASTFLLQQDSDTSYTDVWDAAVPIYSLEKRVGTARIKYTVQDVYSGLQKTVLLIGALALFISLVFSWFLARTFTRPIHQAIGLAEEYGRGNLDASLTMNRIDEVGQLINALNRLSEKLQTVIQEKITVENLAMVGEFSAFIMHDLKNPVTGIALLAEGINENVPEGDELKEYTTELLISARKIQDFLKTVLDIARPEDVYPTPVNLNRLLDSVLDDFNTDSAVIRKSYDETLPVMNMDNHLMSRAVLNLLQNAADASTSGGRILVSTFQDEHMVYISVEDNGVGISKEKLTNIFRPFFSEKSAGHGLGLAMVKKTAILHNGDIIVESVPDQYTRFTISLPKTS